MKKTVFASFLVIVTLSATSLVSCVDSSSGKGGAKKVGVTDNKNKVTIMAYNVENLFDITRDAGRDDFTYLPLEYKKIHPEIAAGCNLMGPGFYRDECLNLDWSEAVLSEKLTRVADSILSVNGRGPDVLIVEEVENINVLQMLNKKLGPAGYQTVVLLEGEDRRGIDVGILSRFPLAEKERIHLLEFKDPGTPGWKRPQTRGIMEAPLKLPNGQTLHVLGLHFPSQANSVQNRIDAVNTLNKVLDDLGPNALVVAGGDSNVTLQEDKDFGLRTTMMASRWKISHQVGCQDCKGTHYYKKAWEFLDILAFSNTLTNGTGSYQVDPASIRVPKAGKYQTFTDGTPARFDVKAKVGVSDHMPIYGEIDLK